MPSHKTRSKSKTRRSDGTFAAQCRIRFRIAERKAVLAGLMVNSMVIDATRTNEEDTVTAYERAFNHAEGDAKGADDLPAGPC